MTASGPGSIAGVAEFLAHARALEWESAERYEELADNMEVHNNPEVAALFRKLAEYGELHAREVEARVRGLDLPRIAPWDFKWTCPEAPETQCTDALHYLMGPRRALELALLNERRGRDFYADVAADAPDPEVRRIAAEMVVEESQHVRLLEHWIAHLPDTPAATPDDPDPPNTPE